MKKLLLSFILFFTICFDSIAAVNITADTSDVECGTGASSYFDNQNSAGMTLCLWLYPTQDIVNTGNPRMVVTTGSGGDLDFRLKTTAGLTVRRAGITVATQADTVNNCLTLNSWQYVCYVLDNSQTAANQHIYVNNSECSQTGSIDGSGGHDVTTGGTIYVGNRSAASRPLGGKIQDLTYWSSQLSTNDRTRAYNGGKQGVDYTTISKSTLQAWWRFNECANGVACSGANQFTDYSGNAHHCSASNSPAGSAPPYTYQSGSTSYGATIY